MCFYSCYLLLLQNSKVHLDKLHCAFLSSLNAIWFKFYAMQEQRMAHKVEHKCIIITLLYSLTNIALSMKTTIHQVLGKATFKKTVYRKYMHFLPYVISTD